MTRIPEEAAALREFAQWCDEEAAKLGAVDGYDYRSGQEAAYRHASIEAGKRAAALPMLPREGVVEEEWQPVSNLPTDTDNTYLALVEQTSPNATNLGQRFIEKGYIAPAENTGWRDDANREIEIGGWRVVMFKAWPAASSIRSTLRTGGNGNG